MNYTHTHAHTNGLALVWSACPSVLLMKRLIVFKLNYVFIGGLLILKAAGCKSTVTLALWLGPAR